MNDLSSRSCLVVDTGGQNVATALRLAKDFGKVWYCTNFHRGFDRLPEAAPGMGFDEIEWVYDEWSVSPDLWVYPDCSHMSIQVYLETWGVRVWGSHHASWLEHKRKMFLETVRGVGLQVPKYEHMVGLRELKSYLDDHPDVFVKCSYWRGSCETHHHISMELSQSWFVHLEKELGPMRNQVPFVVIESIDAVVENGYDGYCIDGQFPKQSLMGIETKDKSYIGTVTDYDDLPDDVRQVNEAFSETLRNYRYRNRWSTEIRVTDNNGFFFLDPTCRIPSPAGEAQLANEKNTGEIYWEGSTGNLVQPEYRKPFAVQVVIRHEDEMCEWRPVFLPDEVKDSVFLKYVCKVDGRYWITPQTHDDIVGWVVGLGDTIQEAIDQVQDVADALGGQSLKVSTDGLIDSLQAVQEQEDAGIPFTDQPVPEPESVVKDA